MLPTKMTDHEAIAKVIAVRDDIDYRRTDKYKKMDSNMREEYTTALAQVINLALSVVEPKTEAHPQKTGLELFKEVLAEKEKKRYEPHNPNRKFGT